MSSAPDSTAVPSEDSQPLSPENLPPVEPPSAGFILQLFVVPAIIVGAVIGIWLLFGRMASSDQDWQRQIDELKQSNEHRRWRGAVSLGQMLQADALAEDESQNLKSNRELATQLGDVLEEQMTLASPSEKDRKLRAYLILALGWLDVDEVTVPLLIKSMDPQHDLETRQNALTAASMIAGRQFEAGKSINNEPLLDAVMSASRDSESDIRMLACYALGLFDSDAADQRLAVLLEDPDEYVKVNAAIALARRKSSLGLSVLTQILERAGSQSSPLKDVDQSDSEAEKKANQDEIELILQTKNALTAIGELAPQLSDGEKAELREVISPIASGFRDPRIQVSASKTLESLQ